MMAPAGDLQNGSFAYRRNHARARAYQLLGYVRAFASQTVPEKPDCSSQGESGCRLSPSDLLALSRSRQKGVGLRVRGRMLC